MKDTRVFEGHFLEKCTR